MNKTVFITGASGGIGAQIAKVFAQHGYNVILNYLKNKEKIEKLQAEIEQNYHVKAYPLQMDVTNEEQIQETLPKMMQIFPKIDCLVNNAAIANDDYPNQKNSQEFKQILNTNVIGPYNMSKYIGEKMQEQSSGVIINVASTNGLNTYETYSMDYDASKAALISLTKNFALYYAPFVRVNAVAPGWTETKAIKDMNPEEIKQEKEKILLNRFATPEEIANVIYFLSTDEATYINGEIIRIDGGMRH